MQNGQNIKLQTRMRANRHGAVKHAHIRRPAYERSHHADGQIVQQCAQLLEQHASLQNTRALVSHVNRRFGLFTVDNVSASVFDRVRLERLPDRTVEYHTQNPVHARARFHPRTDRLLRRERFLQ